VSEISFSEIEFDWIRFNPMEALKKLLTLTGAYLVYDKVDKVHKIKTLLGLSVFDVTAATPVNIYDSILLDGGYESSVKNLGISIQIKYKTLPVDWQYKYANPVEVETTEKTYSIQARTSGANLEAVSEVREVDLSNYVLESDYSFSDIARKYMYVFGLILGHLRIDIVPNHDFKEGSYYSIEDITNVNEIVTFIDKSKDYVAFCYGQDTKIARFVILDISAFQPISAALLMNINSTTEAQLNLDIKDFLYTLDDTIEDATHADYGYKFFEAGQSIQVREVYTYELFTNAVIGSITGNVITLSSGTFPYPVTRPLIITYGARSATATDIQNKHLFVDSGVL